MRDVNAGDSCTKPARSARPKRGSWFALAAIVGLPLGGVVGAFAVAPSTSVDSIEIRRVSEPVEFAPMAIESTPAAGVFWREERVSKGDSVPSLLARLGVDDQRASRWLTTNEKLRLILRSSAGRTAVARISESGQLDELQVRGDPVLLTITRQGDSFVVSEETVKVTAHVEMRSGEISSSLFAAMDDADVPDAIASDFVEIFASDVDLHKDLRKGDRFSIVYETRHAGAELVGTGRILAAEFTSQGRVRQAVYFEDPATHRGDYFSPTGRRMKRTFLRSPLEFSRITSGFSNARLHPVLQVWRAHKGIDYSAPVGSRVRATGDGVVSFAGMQNGYGRVITIKHTGGYTTLYGHLSGIAKDLRVGKPVQQGEVIGFVGMSGLATGPHLHYEFHMNGIHVDPNRSAPEQGPAIASGNRDVFAAVVADRLQSIALMRDVAVASKE